MFPAGGGPPPRHPFFWRPAQLFQSVYAPGYCSIIEKRIRGKPSIHVHVLSTALKASLYWRYLLGVSRKKKQSRLLLFYGSIVLQRISQLFILYTQAKGIFPVYSPGEYHDIPMEYHDVLQEVKPHG